ncbi:FtsK/SpoIIIE family DNA translocase [Azotosporobacter soli]|uniref:FtsK/SpoIIIE family DNA translocase n=1 Tax=Azotosporobacter soli TaxID=3055040 RepID=UPI0031FF3761
MALGVIGLISLYGGNTGVLGRYLGKFLSYAFGIGAVVVPILIMAIGGMYIKSGQAIRFSSRFWGLLLFYVSVLALFHHFLVAEGTEILPESLLEGGGLIGGMVLFLLRKVVGFYGGMVLVLAMAVWGLLLATTWSLYHTLSAAGQKTQEGITTAYESVHSKAETFYNQDKDWRFTTHGRSGKQEKGEYESPTLFNRLFSNSRLAGETEAVKEVPLLLHEEKESERYEAPLLEERVSTPERPAAPPQKVRQTAPRENVKPPERTNNKETPLPGLLDPAPTPVPGQYQLPPLSLLNKPSVKNDGKQDKEVAANAKTLEETLESFGVKAKIKHVSQGPAVTRYELEPAPGVKVSRIVNLADDIALSLAASGVRIEAPIPGKAAIGIEVPNKTVSSVPLRDVLDHPNFLTAKSHLTVALGKDIAGNIITTDLGKMPHLLVAGSTGSGKSVCVNTLLASILFRATPDEVRFILIDPKVVELTSYNGLPHLLTPVVTEAKKAAAALRWAVVEMDRRYEMFAAAGVRDIGRYNEQIDAFPVGDGSSGTKMPYILVVIDELADLMMVSPVDVEDAIIRLAQKARAAGIHMVLATQRPSVDVITGLIKANVPSRIAFAVSSQVDSRTILDMGGAEKLLGKGDMLLYPIGTPKPLRVQGAFIADGEVEALTDYIKAQSEPPEYVDGVTTCENPNSSAAHQAEVCEDELLEDAVRIIMETQQASASMLQRKFRIGFTRAGRLIDRMEELKILGPNVGSKPREILMGYENAMERYFSKNEAASAKEEDD